jgi:hypothetical protein
MSTLRRMKETLAPKNAMVSIMLPAGQYSLRIRNIMRGQEFYFSTCDSVRVYVGIMPIDSK